MFKLYGNGKLMEEFETKEQCKKAREDYKEIAKIMVGRNNIKFKIVEEI